MNHRLRCLLCAVKPAFVALLLVAFGLIAPMRVMATGTWTQMKYYSPVDCTTAILLSDGSVLCMNSDTQCVKLTPDINGSYINGTWTKVASMNYDRLYFGAELLQNGKVYVQGGEDGNGGSEAELYDPVANTWTVIPTPSQGYPDFSDGETEILSNGNVIEPWGGSNPNALQYVPSTNSWIASPYANGGQDEATWLKMPNDTIEVVDYGSTTSEHYAPTLNEWVNDNNTNPTLWQGGETGPAALLPNGKGFFIGGTGNTAIFTEGSTPGSAGTWTTAASFPAGGWADDVSCDMMVNGKVLLCYENPSTESPGFYEYDYTTNTITLAPGSYGWGNMLQLPTGQVMYFNNGGTTALFIYTPDGTPLSAGKPVITGIGQNADGSYTLTGTGFNGLSEGACFGDDWQSHSNYPQVRLTDGSGNVYYARTYNWSSTSVQTGSTSMTTQFTLPANVPAESFTLQVIGNGFASDGIFFSDTAANTYELIVKSTGYCMDAAGGATTNGTAVDQAAYTGTSGQQWNVTALGNGQYYALGVASGRSLNQWGNNNTAGDPVKLYTYTGANNEQFTVSSVSGSPGYYNLLFVNSGQAICVSGASTSSGAVLVQEPVSGLGTSGQWQFQPIVTSGTYALFVNSTDYCLDAKGAGTTNGTPLDQYPYLGQTNQQWNVTPLSSGQYYALGVASGLSLNQWGNNNTAGDPVKLYTYSSGANNEKFTLQDASAGMGYNNLLFVDSGQAISVSGASTSQGAAIVQEPVSGVGTEAQWAFQPVSAVPVQQGTYALQVKSTGYALDANGQGTTNGTPMDQWYYSSTAYNQMWTVTPLSSGQYTAIEMQSGRALTESGNNNTNGDPIQLYDYSSSAANEKFTLASQGSGYYNVLFVNSGLAMCVSGASTSAGALIVQEPASGVGTSGQWEFTPSP